MKKLNNKGFTLVELLAVIVILALLIVVVANTALPALNNAKQSALKVYAQRMAEKAKELYLISGACSETSPCDIGTLGGSSSQYSGSIYIVEDNGTYQAYAAEDIKDTKNKIKIKQGSQLNEDVTATMEDATNES